MLFMLFLANSSEKMINTHLFSLVTSDLMVSQWNCSTPLDLKCVSIRSHLNTQPPKAPSLQESPQVGEVAVQCALHCAAPHIHYVSLSSPLMYLWGGFHENNTVEHDFLGGTSSVAEDISVGPVRVSVKSAKIWCCTLTLI